MHLLRTRSNLWGMLLLISASLSPRGASGTQTHMHLIALSVRGEISDVAEDIADDFVDSLDIGMGLIQHNRSVGHHHEEIPEAGPSLELQGSALNTTDLVISSSMAPRSKSLLSLGFRDAYMTHLRDKEATFRARFRSYPWGVNKLWPKKSHYLTYVQVWLGFWRIPSHALVALTMLIMSLWLFDVNLLQYYCRAHLQPFWWLAFAAGACTYVTAFFGGEAGADWLTGYMYEWVFCIDELFIYHFIFRQYSMPQAFATKALFSCLIGQLVTRFLFYIGLAHIVGSLPILHYLFGAILVYNGVTSLYDKQAEGEEDVTDLWLVKFCERCLGGRLLKRWKDIEVSTECPHEAFVGHRPAAAAMIPEPKQTPFRSPGNQGGMLFHRGADGITRATLLLPVVLCMLIIDVFLGADCSIAKIENIQGAFWNLSSSTLALFGIRSSYCWVAALSDQVSMFQCAIGFILIFIGMELITMDFVSIKTTVSLGIMACIFLTSFLLSAVCPKRSGRVQEHVDVH